MTARKHSPESLRGFLDALLKALLYIPTGLWMLVDFASGYGALLFAHWASPSYRFGPEGPIYDVHLLGIFYGILIIFFWHVLGMYTPGHFRSLVKIILSAFGAAVLAGVGLSLFMTWTLYEQVGRYIFLFSVLAAGGALSLTRVLARGAASRTKRTIAFIGRPVHFARLKRDLGEHYRLFFDEPLFLDTGHLKTDDSYRKAIDSLIERHPAELVVEDNTLAARKIMDRCLEICATGCIIRPLSAFHEAFHQEVNLEAVDPGEYLRHALGTGTYYGRTVKRLIDLMLAGVGLLVTLPLVLFLALLVRMTSKGPAFYSQERVGRYGVPFRIHKLRTMRSDAERNGAEWAKKGDARATPLGRILRKTRLDELPQLWNIFKGDMTIVGPRPERPEFVNELVKEIPGYNLRHLVAPGLTGWAQILYSYGASKEDARRKLGFDLYYIHNYGFTLDIIIIMRTIMTMTKGSR